MMEGITLRKTACLALLLCLLTGKALGEIPCICDKPHCVCFIQLHDKGPAVEFIQNTLVTKGYLAHYDDASTFDEHTQQAVINFQQANNLPATGMMDDETLTLLLWDMLPEALDQAHPETSTLVMWIPTDGGIRHHDTATFRGIYAPRLVSQRNALAMEMLHCGRCKPHGYVKAK